MAKKQKPGAKKTAKATSKEGGGAKEPFRTLTGHGSEVTALAIAPDARTLVSGSTDGEVQLWEIHDGKSCTAFKGDHAWRVFSLSFSPDGKMVAIVWQGVREDVQNQTSVELWNLITRRRHPLREDGLPDISEEERLSLRFPCFSGDSCLLAIKSSRVYLLDTHTREFVINIKVKTTGYSMALSPDGRWLALEAGSRAIHVWDVERKKQVHTLEGHKGVVNRLAFSPDSKVLASASTARPPLGKPQAFMSLDADNTVRLWDIASGKQRGKPVEVGEETACLEILADGKSWMSVDGPGDEAIVRRGGISSSDVSSLTIHWAGVCSAAVSKDGQFVALGDENGTITLWKAGLPHSETTGSTKQAPPAPGKKKRGSGKALRDESE